MVAFLLAANVGLMVFFSAAIAPVVFRVLPEEWAAKYVRAFFPRYFSFLGVTSALAGLIATDGLLQGTLAFCAALSFGSVGLLIPRINAARDAGHASMFRALHGVSIGINFVLLASFAGLLWVGA
jgi:hypothetical protein